MPSPVPFDDAELRRLLSLATVAAYRAGAHVMRYYGRDLTVDTKGATHLSADVVTVADKESQEIILDALADSHPDIGLLGEEDEARENRSRFEKPCFWCIDPLDGTLPFLERVNGFAVAIALVSREGDSLMGVCHLPAWGDLYHAVAGQGAFRNGRPIAFPKDLGGGRLTYSLNPNEGIVPERYAQIQSVARALGKVPGIAKLSWHLHSGAVAKGCLLLEQSPAVFFGPPRPGEQGVSIWDLAATACIVREAGGAVCDAYGAPLELNREGSTYCHHKGFVLASHEAIARAAIEGFRATPGA
jgi:3'-phosphoadenosine 5'-phosphosulfate (PAPS) 3'-phosphatase